MKVDLILKGNNIYTTKGFFSGIIAVENSKIIKIKKDLNVQADEIIDTGNNLVLPGIIDVHVHFRDMGEAQKEDWWTGSQAAVCGGVTTVVDEPNNVPNTVTLDVLKRKKEIADRKSLVDHNFTIGLTPNNIHNIKEFSDKGVKSFEIFEGGDGDYPYITDTGDILEALIETRNSGTLICLNARESMLKSRISKLIKKEGGNKISDLALNSPGFEEAIGATKNILLAQHTGARAHLREISSKNSIEIIRKLKPETVTTEVTPYHLLLTDKDGIRLGPFGLVLPPLKSEIHVNSLWSALNDGTIDIIASDHAPHTKENKERGLSNIWEAPPGVPVIEPMLPLMLTKINEGKLTIKRLIESMSVNPAKIWGFYPRKGVIKVGSDADFTIVDMKLEKTIRGEHLHTKNQWTPFEGMRVKGLPVRTIIRGTTVMLNGEVIGNKGHGCFIS